MLHGLPAIIGHHRVLPGVFLAKTLLIDNVVLRAGGYRNWDLTP